MLDGRVICGKWPEADRWALRLLIDSLPLDEVPICDECFMAFFNRLVIEDWEPTEQGPRQKS